MKKIIICLTGMPGSGKTTVADMLKEHGFTIVELSSQLTQLMSIFGIPFNMKNRVELAVSLKETFGRDILAKLSEEDVKRAKGDVVISGVRSSIELRCIRSQGSNVYAVALQVPTLVRFNRLKKRKGGFEIKNYRELEFRDRSDAAMGMSKVIRAADYTLLNTGTVKQLGSSVEGMLRKIRARRR
jgi:dephospho-CoA kinase